MDRVGERNKHKFTGANKQQFLPATFKTTLLPAASVHELQKV